MKIPVAMRKAIPLLGSMLLLTACSTTHNETRSFTPEAALSWEEFHKMAMSIPMPAPAAAPPLVMVKPIPTAMAPTAMAPTAAPPLVIAKPVANTGHVIAKPVANTGHVIAKPVANTGHVIAKPVASTGHVIAKPPPSFENQPPSAPHVRLAKSAFHVPTPILLKQTVVAQLRINPCKDLESMRRELSPENIKRPGILATAQVEITDYMHAELKADEAAIRVKPLSPGRQKLVPCSTTPWSWNVTGLLKGDHEMIVTLLKILPNGESVTVPTEVYRLKVNVEPIDEFMVRLDQFTAIIKSTTTLVVATIGLIAALGVGWARKRQGKVGT